MFKCMMGQLRNILPWYIYLLCITGCLGADWDPAETNQHLSAEARLHSYLMNNTHLKTRPITSQNETIEVDIGLAVLAFELSERSNIFTVEGWLRWRWRNSYLKWNPEDFDNITSTTLSPKDMWQPDLHLYNSAGDGIKVFSDRILAVVNSAGNVSYFPAVTIQSLCGVDLSQFPYDTQICLLKFGSWVYHDAQIRPTTRNGVDIGMNIPNCEFDIVNASAERYEMRYYGHEETYSTIEMTFELRRRITKTTQLIMAPSIVLTLLLPSIFLLPPESNEKIMLGIGVLLGHLLMFNQLEAFIPESSPSLPNIAIFFTTNIVLVSVSLFVSALLLNIRSRSYRGQGLPQLVRTIFLNCIGKILCVSADDFISVAERSHVKHTESEAPCQEVTSRFSDKMQMITASPRDIISGEWLQLACVLDRLLFLLFVIICIIMAFVMGHY